VVLTEADVEALVFQIADRASSTRTSTCQPSRLPSARRRNLPLCETGRACYLRAPSCRRQPQRSGGSLIRMKCKPSVALRASSGPMLASLGSFALALMVCRDRASMARDGFGREGPLTCTRAGSNLVPYRYSNGLCVGEPARVNEDEGDETKKDGMATGSAKFKMKPCLSIRTWLRPGGVGQAENRPGHMRLIQEPAMNLRRGARPKPTSPKPIRAKLLGSGIGRRKSRISPFGNVEL
jgi:hypothetical protein